VEVPKNINNLTGKTLGNLFVIDFLRLEKSGKLKKTKTVWQCKCLICNSICERLGDSMVAGHAKSCGCLKKRKGENNPCWSGYGGLSQGKFREIRNGAKTRKIKFNLTKKQLWELFQKQNGKCALTFLPLDLTRDEGNSIRENASLDRIDSAGSYEIKNVRWLHKDVNLMKNVLSDSRLVELCNLVVKNNP
jgi:hypothetical protein